MKSIPTTTTQKKNLLKATLESTVYESHECGHGPVLLRRDGHMGRQD